MHIREAEIQDLKAILSLYQELHADDPVMDEHTVRRVFTRILHGEGLHLRVLEHEGRVVATCYLNIIPNLTRRAAPYGIIENVVTTAALRGQGLGKALVRQTLAFAWAAGCYKVMLQTGSTNPGTHAFYRACGFSDTEKTSFVARPGQGS